LGAQVCTRITHLPDQASGLLIQHDVIETDPDLIVAVEGWRHGGKVQWPQTVPIISVIPPHRILKSGLSDLLDKIGDTDALAWFRSFSGEEAETALPDDPRLVVMPPAAETGFFRPIELSADQRQRYGAK